MKGGDSNVLLIAPAALDHSVKIEIWEKSGSQAARDSVWLPCKGRLMSEDFIVAVAIVLTITVPLSIAKILDWRSKDKHGK